MINELGVELRPIGTRYRTESKSIDRTDTDLYNYMLTWEVTGHKKCLDHGREVTWESVKLISREVKND